MTRTGSERKTNFIRVLLFILAALFIFGGPTYAVYVLRHLASLPYVLAVLVGLTAFAVGILLFMDLIGRQTKLNASKQGFSNLIMSLSALVYGCLLCEVPHE